MKKPSKVRGCSLTLLCLMSGLVLGQIEWDENEIANVFDGIDLSAALARVEAKGVTPYDFGFHLLRSGHPEKAKEWFIAVGIQTKEAQYIYGLAWVKWVTGDSKGAIEDAKYLLARDPSPLIRARTLYLLGAVSVDEHEFEAAKHNLKAGIKAYKALNKSGGLYLCTSMLAMCAVYEGDIDAVEPLLDIAAKHNEEIRAKGKKANPQGRRHEIMSEMKYTQGDYVGALLSAQESAASYRAGGKHHLADDVDAKIGLLLLMTGEPKAAQKLASSLWKKHHNARSRSRLLAYNSITLMKLSMCSGNHEDAADKEHAARSWAMSGPGGRALVRLIEWVKEEKNLPCPEWR